MSEYDVLGFTRKLQLQKVEDDGKAIEIRTSTKRHVHQNLETTKRNGHI